MRRNVLAYQNLGFDPYEMPYEERPYPDYVPTIAKLKRAYRYPLADYSFSVEGYTPAKGERKEGLFLLHVRDLYKSSYYAFRNRIHKPFVKEKTVFVSPSYAQKNGLKDGDKALLKLGGKEYEVAVAVSGDVPDGLILFKGLFYDLPLNEVVAGKITPVDSLSVSRSTVQS
jgi:anaerobic selenocysteine-containing dehydrogenase